MGFRVTCKILEMSQGRAPLWASSTIFCLVESGNGLPFTNTPPSWLTPLWPVAHGDITNWLVFPLKNSPSMGVPLSRVVFDQTNRVGLERKKKRLSFCIALSVWLTITVLIKIWNAQQQRKLYTYFFECSLPNKSTQECHALDSNQSTHTIDWWTDLSVQVNSNCHNQTVLKRTVRQCSETLIHTRPATNP